MTTFVASHILALPGWVALLVVFLVPALESSAFLGFVFPGEIALLLGGVLAFEGRVPLPAVLAAGVAGAVMGDSVGYLVGRRWGWRLLRGRVGRLVRTEHRQRAEDYLRTRGGKAVFLGRFTAALRVTIPGLSGMARMPYATFAAYNVAGGVVWATAMVVLGYAAGSSWRRVEHLASRVGLAVLAAVVLTLVLAYLVRRHGGRLAGQFERSEVVRRTRARHPRAVAWLVARVDPRLPTGLPLTLALTVAAAASWIFGGVTQDVVAREELARFDPTVLSWVLHHRTAWLTDAFRAVTWLGASVVTLPVLALAAILLFRRTRTWWPVVDVAVVYATAVLAHAVVSLAVHRPRPPQADWLAITHGWSYPSGHTTQAVAAWGILAVLAFRYADKRYRPVVLMAATLVATAVGVSRIYLGVHWFTDVVGGVALSVAVLATWVVLHLVRGPVTGAEPERSGVDGIPRVHDPVSCSPAAPEGRR